MLFHNSKYYNSKLDGLAEIESSLHQLIKCIDYLTSEEQQQVIDCCFFAAQAHAGQKRQSGEPYICHPIKVAEILANEVQFGLPVLLAAVLHDVIEDTPTEKNGIIEIFDKEVADLVDGVSKLEKNKGVSPQMLQALTFEKLAFAMAADPRVVMIKFADRMHNMQTLGALERDKRRRIAQETLDVYVPIASRLGMHIFERELADLAFKHLHPWRYRTIAKLLKDNATRQAAATTVKSSLHESFRKADLTVSIRKRRRSLYYIYKKLQKMRFNRRPLERASIPFVLMTKSIDDCYRVLGVIHQAYTPVVNKLTDYIASPKANGYRSIHTSVLTTGRRVINFQIRTKEMHAVAESGIIAIWREHNKKRSASAKEDFDIKVLDEGKSIRRWLGQVKDLSHISSSSLEYYNAIKRDLTGFEIQVLTPKGEPVALPKGATVIDFAYYVRTAIGNHLSGAKVNGVDVPLDYCLDNGQTVEVFSSVTASPRSIWLKRVKTARARTAIRHSLRELPIETLETMGRQEIQGYLSRRGIHYHNLTAMLAEIAEENYRLSLQQFLRKIALYELKRRPILYELQKIARRSGVETVVFVSVLNQPGVLAATADAIGRHGANITRIRFPDNMRTDEVSMAFEINIERPQQLESIIDELNQLSLVQHVKYEEKSS